MPEIEYREGSWILHDGEKDAVEVLSKEEDIKDGYPGFEGRYANGKLCWGYDSQIDSVVQF